MQAAEAGTPAPRRGPANGLASRIARRLPARALAWGALSALAFALSFPLSEDFTAGWPLAFVWPALLAFAVRSAPRPISLVLAVGAPFYLAFLAQQWWMRHITELGMPVLVLYLAGWTVILALVIRRMAALPMALVLPAALVAVEYLRGSLLCSGYAWFFAAHPLVEWTAVAQIAALGGGWLVTALVGLVAGAAVDLVVRRDRAQAMSPATAVIALIAAVAYGHARIDAHDAAVRATPRPRLLVVQTNLPMSNKLAWTPEQQVEDFITFAKQTIDGAAAARDAGGPIDLALWPETTVPGLGLEPESIRMLVENGYYPGDRYEEALRDLAMRIDAPLLVGSPAYLGLRVEGNRFAWDHQFNSAYLVGSEGVLGRTDKIYLTPFGEIMPIISNWAWLESQLLALGADGMTFDLEEAKAASAFGVESDSAGACSIAVPICFEITQPWAARRIVFPGGARAAGVVANLSNDGWFAGSTAGRRQHLQVSQLRAIELGTPVIRCVNTGLSASIDAVGRVEAVLPPGRPGTFVATPAPADARPLAVSVGDGIALAALVLVLLGIARGSRGGAGALASVVTSVAT
jgi:apolipoprotein N-acyltransferase